MASRYARQLLEETDPLIREMLGVIVDLELKLAETEGYQAAKIVAKQRDEMLADRAKKIGNLKGALSLAYFHLTSTKEPDIDRVIDTISYELDKHIPKNENIEKETCDSCVNGCCISSFYPCHISGLNPLPTSSIQVPLTKEAAENCTLCKGEGELFRETLGNDFHINKSMGTCPKCNGSGKREIGTYG